MDMLLRSHCDKGEFQAALEIAERARGAFKKIGDEVPWTQRGQGASTC